MQYVINEAVQLAIKDIEGLVIVEEEHKCWDWTYRKASSDIYHETPLDAFIDFTKTIVRANDKLTGGDISYDED